MGRAFQRVRTLVALWAALAAILAVAAATVAPADAGAGPGERLRAVSIDPADYLADHRDASALAERLVDQLSGHGVNAIYVNAYNVEYGAYYRTSYSLNEESEYGRQDLLGKLLAAAHARGMQVYAAFYDHQHRGAWEANPGWRAKTESGGDYNPPGTDVQYYLSTGHPEVIAWWRGFLLDILRRYPKLDGIELREPIVTWWGTTADHNPAVNRAFRRAHPEAEIGDEAWRRFRQDTLTRFLAREIRLVHGEGRLAHVTSVASVDREGNVISAATQARETGFDLERILAGAARPDAIKVELIWQQWARLYGRIAFTPEWTRAAYEAFRRYVRGRAPLVVHVELTDFGRLRQTNEEFLRALRAADAPTAAGVDFYSASLADAKRAWPAVRAVYRTGSSPQHPAGIRRDRRVLVLTDETGTAGAAAEPAELQRAELLNLIAHTGLPWEARAVDRYTRGDLEDFDAVVYLGTRYGNAPAAFLTDVSVFEGSVVWIGQNLFQLRASGVDLPFTQPSQRAVTRSGVARYRSTAIPARGEILSTQAGSGVDVVARVEGSWGTLPYVLRHERFWYVAGSPFSFLETSSGLNGRYLAFADALHDMLGVRHAGAGRAAYLRIEGVTPQADPDALRGLVAVLSDRGTPFLVSVTPFYEDPARDVSTSLSKRPELVAALREAVASGGAIVLHGSTHQYRGRTGADAELWDLVNGGGIAEDGDEYVRPRVEAALRELWRNDLHPLAWQTPRGLATPFDYALLSDYFSTFVERRTYGAVDGAAQVQPLPYAVEADVYGGRVIPDSLAGLVGTDVAGLLRRAAALSVVRDGTAGASVDLSTDPEVVAEVVDGLRRLGFRLSDLYTLGNVVEAPGRVELTASGSASLPVPTGWTLEQRVLARDGTALSTERTTFVSYGRPAVAFPEGGALLSLEALAEPVDDDGWLPGTGSAEDVLVAALTVLGAVGVAALLAAWAGAHVGGRRAARR